MTGILDDINGSVQKGREKSVSDLIVAALEDGVSARSILEEAMLPAMDTVGGKFKSGELFIPHVLMAAKAMKAGMAQLRPYLVASDVKPKGTVVLGTVKGDLHDIGKNLVKMMMEGKGLDVVDLGVDVSAEKFVSAALENGAAVIGCSALLTTTMPEMKKVVELIKSENLSEKIKVMIGGAPVTQQYCDAINADIYTPDAASAAEAAFSAIV
ncbi:MAG: cobalamin-dependent protein [Bacillota bacterium]|nr:cobalamin-dependent protein [Bacillota bacterium]